MAALSRRSRETSTQGDMPLAVSSTWTRVSSPPTSFSHTTVPRGIPGNGTLDGSHGRDLREGLSGDWTFLGVRRPAKRDAAIDLDGKAETLIQSLCSGTELKRRSRCADRWTILTVLRTSRTGTCVAPRSSVMMFASKSGCRPLCTECTGPGN